MEIFMMDHKTHGITVIRLFDGCFVGHEIDCLSTVNEKQFEWLDWVWQSSDC